MIRQKLRKNRLHMFIMLKPRQFRKKNLHITKPNSCHSCAELHFKSDCPFKSKICYFCGKSVHISPHCRRKKIRSNLSKECVNVVILKRWDSNLQRRKFINIKMNNNYIRCQLDTGSNLLIISENTWKNIGKPKLTHWKSCKRCIW